MKQLYLIILTGLLFVTTQVSAAITVKFQKPESWTAVSLYTWGPEVLGGWPGASLTEVDGWYTYTFDESFTGANLIFNNAGAGEQTEDFVISASVCLRAANTLNNNGKYDISVVPCDTDGIQVSFIAPASWTGVSLYTWGPEVLGGWPGASLTETGGWYTYTFDASFTGANLIFNNAGAGQQTEDYTISGSVCLQASSELNQNGKYDVTVIDCTTGLGENKISNVLNIYPNPADDKIVLTGKEKIRTASIHTSTGNRVMTITGNQPEIDISNLQPGVYILRAEMQSGRIRISKIVKK